MCAFYEHYPSDQFIGQSCEWVAQAPTTCINLPNLTAWAPAARNGLNAVAILLVVGVGIFVLAFVVTIARVSLPSNAIDENLH